MMGQMYKYGRGVRENKELSEKYWRTAHQLDRLDENFDEYLTSGPHLRDGIFKGPDGNYYDDDNHYVDEDYAVIDENYDL